ncbi:hypothetical protein [Mesobacillus foraminis]|uniref:Uncharacterized protein n=1 Tax=Mesobacillus foraminis TaxID=279826 RepID=A0A4R2BCJ3_9BACI|nr:hypothetical protein [Mesobacillus foraminis]TCN24145.1 hypothetical protein EV146_108259 [Mesobacillus foraminis]
MYSESQYDVEAVVEKETYATVVSYQTLELMFKASVVTIKGTSVAVQEVEVTDSGRVRFHGNLAEL